MVAVHTCSDNFYLVLEEQEMVNRLGKIIFTFSGTSVISFLLELFLR